MTIPNKRLNPMVGDIRYRNIENDLRTGILISTLPSQPDTQVYSLTTLIHVAIFLAGEQ